MKSVTISGILLIVMAAYLILPALPVIDYLVNKDFIAKNLCVNKDKPRSCCNGKCHLVKQLQKTNQNPQKDPKNTDNRIQLKDFNEYVIDTPVHLYLTTITIKHLVFNTSEPEQLICSAVFVPPKPASQT